MERLKRFRENVKIFFEGLTYKRVVVRFGDVVTTSALTIKPKLVIYYKCKNGDHHFRSKRFGFVKSEYNAIWFFTCAMYNGNDPHRYSYHKSLLSFCHVVFNYQKEHSSSWEKYFHEKKMNSNQ